MFRRSRRLPSARMIPNRQLRQYRQLARTHLLISSAAPGRCLVRSLRSPLVTPEAMALDFSNEGGVGGTYQLLKNIMGLWILQECKREWEEQGDDISFAELVVQAEQRRAFPQPHSSG